MRPKLKRTVIVFSTALVILYAYESVRPSDRGLPRSLVTAQGTIHPVNDFPILLKKTLQAIQRNSQCDNLILFVHGRGKHPGKAFRQRLLTDLQKDYSAKVIMFHWPSWNGPLGFPEQAARDSAEDFVTVLKAIKTFKAKHADLIQGVRFTLLTQSMGSLVLEESALRLQNDSLGTLFDTLVISASASCTRDHAAWVSPMDLSGHIYILMNRDDPVLGSAGLRERGRRLGKGLKSRGKTVKLADRAVYIDATKVTLLHRYYLHRNLRQSPALKHFFDQVLNGLPATLDPYRKIILIHEQQCPNK
jgi:esterase/lipase superfamily enzyme